jgi:signal-transduction protein with cAMP-binding, CBS, and nucleotidyltransferase domain
MKKADWFRKLNCFDQLDDHQLCDLVERITLLELKKDEFVFKEGDQSDHMFLFIEGEAKAQKTVDLFKEDPNALYHSQYVQQTKRKHKPT